MPRSISRVVLCCGFVALTVVSEGCQRGTEWNLASVEGTVTKEGRPLSHIGVVFLTESESGTQGPRASGTTDESGRYHLRTDNGDEGAVVGKHRVVIQDRQAVKERMGRTASGSKTSYHFKKLAKQGKASVDVPRVPARYGSFNSTPLRVDVHPGSQTLDFDLSSGN